MQCNGMVNEVRPCRRPAWFLVRSRSAAGGFHSCRYHLIDFVDRVTGGGVGFPAIVMRLQKARERGLVDADV